MRFQNGCPKGKSETPREPDLLEIYIRQAAWASFTFSLGTAKNKRQDGKSPKCHFWTNELPDPFSAPDAFGPLASGAKWRKAAIPLACFLTAFTFSSLFLSGQARPAPGKGLFSEKLSKLTFFCQLFLR